MFQAQKGKAIIEVDYKDGRLSVVPRPTSRYYESVCTTIANSLTILLGIYLKEQRPQDPYTALVGYFEQHGWTVTELRSHYYTP